MASRFAVRSTPDQAVWVRALARDIVLCSWARHVTLAVPLSTQVHKWVLMNAGGNLVLHATETGISSGTDRPLGSYANVLLIFYMLTNTTLNRLGRLWKQLQFDCIC